MYCKGLIIKHFHNFHWSELFGLSSEYEVDSNDWSYFAN